jgi:uncharacterized protein (TIGR02145 family)
VVKTKEVTVIDCHEPGLTVNFTAFDPCSDAAIGAVWYLTDTRESNNVQIYKVKKMADGRIWMIQDIKFGDKCNKTTFTGSTSNQTGKVTSLTDKTYYGDCTNIRNSNTPSNRGYLYDWAATVNKENAFRSSSYKGCSGTTTGTEGTAPGACQGICPVGWHVPTSNTSGEFGDANTKFQNTYNCANQNCWLPSSEWDGVLGGGVYYTDDFSDSGIAGLYWSSTNSTSLDFTASTFNSAGGHWSSDFKSVRCVRNY